MASFKSHLLSVESLKEWRVWVSGFEAHCRGKQLADKPDVAGTTPQRKQFLQKQMCFKTFIKNNPHVSRQGCDNTFRSRDQEGIEDYVEP